MAGSRLLHAIGMSHLSVSLLDSCAAHRMRFGPDASIKSCVPCCLTP